MFSTLLGKIGTGIATLLVSIATLINPQVVPQVASPNLGVQNAVGGERYFLSGSGITSSASSVGLTKFGYTQPNGTYAKFTMTNFGDLGCATIQPGNASGKQEFVSFTGITQNADGTATLSGVTRGLERYSPYSASTTLQTAHAGGSELVISNSPPCFYEGYANRTQNEEITGLWEYTTIPYSYDTATSTQQFATRAYANSLAVQGAATSTTNASGIGLLATGAQAAAGTYTLTSPYFLSSAISTSTYFGGYNNQVIVTKTNGSQANTIDPNFIATSSDYTWGGTHTLNNLLTFNAGTTFNALMTMGSSTQASSTITTLLATNATTTSLRVGSLASTTDLKVSGTCDGCILSGGSGYQIIQTTVAFNGGTPSTAAASLVCPSPKIVISGGWNPAAANSTLFGITQSYASASTTWSFNATNGNGDTSNITYYAICVRP